MPAGLPRPFHIALTKTPIDAKAYKQWVCQIAQRSTEATKEGGLLGFGGEKVSEAQTTALKEVAGALGITF